MPWQATPTTWVRRKRAALKRRKMPLPAKLSVNSVHDKINSIRLLWLQGRCDAEVRRTLNIGIEEFRHLKELMQTVKLDRETAQAAFENYAEEHEKFRARQEETLGVLARLMEAAIVRHPMGDSPKDIRAARRTAHDIAAISESILQSQQLLLSIKTKLGLIDMGSESGDGEDDSMLFKSSSIREVWKAREARDVTPK